MKKTMPLLVLFLATCFFIIGCGTNNTDNLKENQDTSLTAGSEIDSNQLISYSSMIHHTDEEVMKTMGEGEATYQDNATADVISARLYQNNILGFAGETILVYGGIENPTVNEVLITFSGATFSDVVDAVSQQLGDAISFEDDGKGTAEAEWQYNTTIFHLSIYNKAVMMGIWEDKSLHTTD